ncbi:hypothetical protein [Nocardia rhizosphaerae]|uniref:Uncharacterized protein n=1 Tax=Nocardia rhizosphaerae TaxID=1691571 RepID=A0ABV8LA11_9NOCA
MTGTDGRMGKYAEDKADRVDHGWIRTKLGDGGAVGVGLDSHRGGRLKLPAGGIRRRDTATSEGDRHNHRQCLRPQAFGHDIPSTGVIPGGIMDPWP